MSTEFKVGGLVLIAIVVLAFFIVRIEDIGAFDDETAYTVHAVFDDAAGLGIDAPVLLAGVRVGRVVGVSLTDEGRARATIRIRREVTLHEDAVAVVGSSGMLGDKVLQIDPGSRDAPLVADGGTIAGGDPASVDQMVSVVSRIANDLQETTDSVARVLGTEAGEASLREILVNLEGFTEELDRFVRDNRTDLDSGVAGMRQTIDNLNTLSGRLVDSMPQMVDDVRAVATELREVLDANEGDLGAASENLRVTTERLERSATDLEQLLEKMNRGEGTVARMVNEPETVDKLNEALESVDDTLAAADTFFRRIGQARFSFQLRSELYESTESTKNYFGLRMELGEQTERGFIFHFIDDNIGGITETNVTTEILDPRGNVIDRIIERRLVREEGFSFSAQLAQRLRDWQFRGGILENEAGFGIDYFAGQDRWRFSLEGWDLGRDPDPHVKLRAQYRVVGRFFVTGGWDDILRSDLRSFFLGGGYSFR